MRRQLYGPGDIIFREGDESREVYRVVGGCVAITIQDTDKGELTLAELLEGDIFGEMAMLDESPRSATATATAPCEVEVMEPGDFNAMFISNPAVLAPYLACLIDRLRSSNERIFDLNSRLQTLEKVASVEGRPKKLGLSMLTDHDKGCFLEPLHSIVKRTLPKPKVVIPKFPFRVGRSDQQLGPDIFQCNDLSLVNIDPAQVAKNHISIELENGSILVRDRNTRRGTLVNGKRLHQDSGELICRLTEEENEIVLGDTSSKAAYRLTISKL